MSKDIYESPLSSRYASPYMLHLFSPDMRFQTWRRLWVELARAEHELGLPITAEQVAELEAHVTDIDYAAAEQREKEVRHDVMAHVYAYGLAAPSAAGIIHLGATSCYVTDNADLILYRDGLRYLRGQILSVLVNLAAFARQYAATPTLGYTHYQPAQPVTVGKRAALWMQDFRSDLEELDHVLATLRFLGCRGTTGTEASFMDLFEGDGAKIDEMNRRIAAEFGFEKCFSVSGQTYPRKADSRILNVLSSIAQSAYRMANDLRLLQHDRQVEEPFEKNQIGSSAMAYKRNPMRCERICSLSRYLMADAANAPMTASVQWLERTLDDSANRRISLPEGFLCADAVLRLCQNVTNGLHVNEKIVDRTIREYLVNCMRPLIFSTALPPTQIAWTRFIFERLPEFSSLREELTLTSHLLSDALEGKGGEISESHIIPYIIGENNDCISKAEELQRKGFYCLPVRPPTVPKGTARIRFSLTADITTAQLTQLIKEI